MQSHAGEPAHADSTTAADVVVEIAGLTRRFGATTALDVVSLSLPRSVVYGLVGTNGAGKTTLIKHVLGLLRAFNGGMAWRTGTTAVRP